MALIGIVLTVFYLPMPSIHIDFSEMRAIAERQLRLRDDSRPLQRHSMLRRPRRHRISRRWREDLSPSIGGYRRQATFFVGRSDGKNSAMAREVSYIQRLIRAGDN